jgi:two-component system cell cycle sensor histidine kinase/response regulator CckA
MNKEPILNSGTRRKIKNTIYFRITNKILIVGISSVIIFWIVESIIHTYIFNKGDFFSHIFTVDLHEIWMRLIVSLLLMTFTIYIQIVTKKVRLVNEELNQIFNTAADGMRVIDKYFNVIRINETFSLLSGVSKDEAIGKKCYEVFHGPMCNTSSCPLTRIIGGDERIECDVEKERKDGTIIPCILTAIPFRGLDGEIIGIVEDFRDITERKLTNEVLMKSEERFRTLQDNVPVGIFRSSPEGEIISANSAFIKMFGCDSEEELLAVPANDFYLNIRDRDELFKLLRDKGEAVNFEAQLKRKDGSTFWGSSNIKAITDEEGKIIYQDGILEDITKRKESSEKILRAKQEWERTFDSFPDLIMILDENHTILRVNKAMADRLGMIPGKLVGQTCFKICHETDKPPECCPCTKMLKKGKGFTQEVHDEVLGGDFIVSCSPMNDAQGNLIGIVHIARDITESKKMEQELRKTQRIESLGLLAGGIAHDFNNILSAILVNIGLAKMYTKSEDDTLTSLCEAENAVSRAKNLTQQLLTFSKGGAPTRTPTSIDRLLRDTADFASRGSNVKCEYSVPEDLWDVEIDEGQISQVVQNLVINAVQAMPEGGVVLIQVENVAPEGNERIPLKEERYIRITVKDQGLGIPRHHLDKIFDPFFTTKQKGSGLGLSTAYSIIKNHNGLITVDSELGKSTAFYIYLPASKENRVEEEVHLKRIAAGQGKILLVDAEEIILKATGELLHEIGYTVEMARDGVEAVKRFEEAGQANQPYDIVILDLIVPGGLGGQQTIRKLLKIDPKVKVVVSSGYSNDPVLVNYKKYGFAGAIAKPYKIEELSTVIWEALGKGK